MTHKKLIISILLGTMSYLVMYISIPIIPIVPYMTLDLSGILVLLSFFILNQKYGYITLLTKEILHLILKGLSIGNLIGVIADALAIIVLAEVLFFIIKKYKNHFIIATVISAIIMTVVMSILNYYIILPLYIKVLGMQIKISLLKVILFGVVPFNLIKGTIVSGLTVLLLPRLFKILKLKSSI